MPSVDAARAKVAELTQRVSAERVRAARAAAIATRYEARVDMATPPLRALRDRMVTLHRRLEARHLESARLQELYATRLRTWAHLPDNPTARPTLIDAVATAIGAGSTAVTMVGRKGVESLVAASDATALIAHDVEFILGEGPARDVTTGNETVEVGGDLLRERWPRFAAAVADQGVAAVVGVPLRQEPGGCLGALCVYQPVAVVTADLAAASARVADALTHTVLNLPGRVADDEIPTVPLFDDADFHTAIHQAAGIVSVQHSCGPTDAIALLRARAFADGLPLEALAHRVIQGEARL